MKKIYKLLILIIVIILTCVYNIDFIILKLKGANYLVRQSDKDDIYSNLILIKNNTSSIEFHEILMSLLNENNANILTKTTAIRIVNDYNFSEYLPQLIKIKNNLTPISFDTTWTYIISEYDYDSFNHKNLELVDKYKELVNIDTIWRYKINLNKDSTIILKNSFFVYCLDIALLKFEKVRNEK